MVSFDLIISSQNHLHRTKQQEWEQGLYGQQTSSA